MISRSKAGAKLPIVSHRCRLSKGEGGALEVRDLAIYRLAAGVFALVGRARRGDTVRSEVLADVAVDVAELSE